MKKISIFFIFLLFSHFAFAKSWQNNIGFGPSIPFFSIGIDLAGEDDINQLGFGIEGTYIGVHKNGFTLQANVSFGLLTSRDISLQDRKTNIGAFENIVLGAGYSFVNSEKALFGVCGTFGTELGQYSVSEDDGTNTISLITFSVGADVFAIYRISEKFGFFANFAARYLVLGTETFGYKQKRDSESKTMADVDLFGKFIVQPTIGVIWTF